MESNNNQETKSNNNFAVVPKPTEKVNKNIKSNELIEQTNENKNTEVIIVNNTNNNENNNNKNNNSNNNNDAIQIENSNPTTVDEIHVNVNQNNPDVDMSSIKNDISSKFLFKIYGILFFQFIIVFGFVLIFQIKNISDFIKTHPLIYWSVYIFTFLAFWGIVILSLFKPDLLQKVPINYFILFIITLFLGLFCGVFASIYKYEIVIFS